jgi:hypothetical protein
MCELIDLIERLLTVDRDLVRESLTNAGVYFHDAITLVNHTKYGGSGYAQVAVCSRHVDAIDIALHELGHSAFALGDEYTENNGTYIGVEPAASNLTLAMTLGTLKWSKFVTPGTPIPTRRNPICGQTPPGPASTAATVGTFESGDGFDCGIYHPAALCKMSDRSQDFCKVCQARIEDKLSAI